MTRTLPWLVALAALVLAAAEAAPGARAQDLDDTAFLCRVFKQPFEEGPALDTSDHTSEVGHWIADQRARGWRLDAVDWEIASKPSGYPQAYAHVCLKR